MNKFPWIASYPVLGPAGSSSTGGGVVGEEVEDDVLVARAQRGETRAFDTLVTRHQGRIYAMIRNMVQSDADAWDLSQESFLKAWHALPRFEAKAKFSTWLFRIAHNVVYDWVRKKKIEGSGELNDETLRADAIDPAAATAPSLPEAPDDSLSQSELRAKIEAALAKLSPEHREAVVLKDVQGLSYKEIADVMGCTLGTVMSRLFYARKNLQLLLQDEYDAR